VITQTFKLGRLLVVAVALATLAGCTVTSIVARSDPSLTVPSKLVSARVTWVENTYIPIRIIKSQQYYKPSINDYEKAEAQQIVGQLVSTFRSSAPEKIRAQLASYKVNEGADATIALTPVNSAVHVGAGRELEAKATIRRAGSTTEIWTITIKVRGPRSLSDEVLLDKFLATLMSELKSAGWLS
jgi:hypothetical protein